jgi:hypothetical protein
LQFINDELGLKDFLTNNYPPQKDCANVTPDAYAALKIGASYREAVRILGCEGFEGSRSSNGWVSYRWTAPDGHAWIFAHFDMRE